MYTHKQLVALFNKISKAEARLEELRGYTHYPYKDGHMICILRYNDTWAESEKHIRMCDTQHIKIGTIWDQLEANYKDSMLSKDAVIDQLVDAGFQIDEVVCVVTDWFLDWEV